MKAKVDARARSVFPRPIYLGAATRTPIGKFGGTLKRFSAPELATLALKEAIRRVPDAKSPDAVILGHARQAGAGPNPARQATIFAGLSETVPATTVNLACASGLSAVFSAVEKIALGRAESIWAGGVESMSNTPYLLPNARFGYKMGNATALDGMVKDGFFCPMSDMLMGETVERFLTKDRGITREAQDAYALESQNRAEKAWKSGAFNAETFEIPAEGKNLGLRDDEHRRGDVTLAQLAKLPPVFDLKSGSVTAGNSSGITDGAAFLHVSSERNSATQAEVLDFEVIAMEPRLMGLGPVTAVLNLLGRHGLKVEDLASVELNEAFAAQVLACQQTLNIPTEILNPRGGAIALGHPIGATGARILTTLLHTLGGNAGSLGVATLCVSGGHGVAILVRSV
ncbi:MAG: thiolase family protein [Cryobacterium sp.]|nr:thiolase family protein [Oligoflexia bacterium]